MKILVRKLVTCFVYMLRVFPVKKNKILICNFYGRGFGDNSKYIYQEMRNMNQNFVVYWVVDNEISKASLPEDIRPVSYRSLTFLYHTVTSKIWIDNSRKLSYLRKRKNQFYLQTWHAGIHGKRVEYDVLHSLSSEYIKCAKNDSAMIDLFISNSMFETNLIRSSFWYNGQIIECGLPRNDILFNHKKNCILYNKIKKKIKLDDKKILLYAPTFRKVYGIKSYLKDFSKLIDTLENKFNGKWVVLLKLHPNMVHGKSKYLLKNCIDVSNWEDMSELLLISDIMITDYSSCMFDYMIQQKPVFLYASDIDDYIKDRNFYINIHNLPFPLAENEDKLIKNIENFNMEKYQNQLKEFENRVGISETGNASKIIAHRLLEEMNM